MLAPPNSRESLLKKSLSSIPQKSISSSKVIKSQEFVPIFTKLLIVWENLMKEYRSLLKIYETNEWKLQKIIRN